jgi:hypothetical protein
MAAALGSPKEMVAAQVGGEYVNPFLMSKGNKSNFPEQMSFDSKKWPQDWLEAFVPS